MKFLDILNSYGLSNNINFATSISGNTLDLVISRNVDNLSNYYSEPGNFISDHCFVTLILDIVKDNETETKEITSRNINAVDLNLFKEELQKSNLKKLTTSKLNINEMINIYDTSLINLLNKHAPEKTKTIKIKPQSPWYTNQLCILKKEKRK